MPRPRHYKYIPRPPYADTRFITNLILNLKREGRGRYAFLILPETFERIVEIMSTYQGRSKEKVLKVVMDAYKDGHWYDDDAGVSSETVRRWLRRAAEDLGLDLDGRSIAITTLLTSNKVLLSARTRKRRLDVKRLDLFMV